MIPALTNEAELIAQMNAYLARHCTNAPTITVQLVVTHGDRSEAFDTYTGAFTAASEWARNSDKNQQMPAL